jgi:hypothetical protein
MHILTVVEGPHYEIEKLIRDLSARWVPRGSAKNGPADIQQLAVRELRFIEISCPQTAQDQVMGMLHPVEDRPLVRALLLPFFRPMGYVPLSKKDFRTPQNYRDIIDHQYTHIIPIGRKKDKFIDGHEVV